MSSRFRKKKLDKELTTNKKRFGKRKWKNDEKEYIKKKKIFKLQKENEESTNIDDSLKVKEINSDSDEECVKIKDKVNKKKLDVQSVEESASENSGEDETNNETITSDCLPIKDGFNWDDEDDEKVCTSSDEDEDEDDGKANKKKDKNKDKIKYGRANELYLREREEKLLNKDLKPETPQDFERMILNSPNSSIIWISFMSYYLDQGEIDSARNVAERALKTIAYREENEKLNIWVAFLNLENTFGSDETVQSVFNRACQLNDSYKIHKIMVNILIQSQKVEAAHQKFQIMLKKFKNEKDVWIEYGLFLMKNNNLSSARKLMERSFKSVHKTHHIDIISKFGQMEFQFGDIERGKTIFQDLLANYSKRVDLWSIYIDMCIKYGLVRQKDTIENIRNIFEQAITLKIPAKKMATIFKKYVEFEVKYGNESTSARVRQKAIDFAEGKDNIEIKDEKKPIDYA